MAIPPLGPGDGRRLAAVFGLLSFLQAVAEPTEGLAAQPVTARLLGAGLTAGGAARFAAVLTLPWVFKPLLGLLTDLAPRHGARRRGPLAAAGAAGALAFLTLAVVRGSPAGWLAGLFVAAVAAALGDAATNALAVDLGRADGRTGRYQASQWFWGYAAAVATGAVGGVLSARGRVRLAMLACGAASAALVVVAAVLVREPGGGPGGVVEPVADRGGRTARALAVAARSPGVAAVAAFLALGSVNPITSGAVLQFHMTRVLGFGDSFFGATVSVQAASSMAAAAVYGRYGRLVPLRTLAGASVALGVVNALVYAATFDGASAVLVAVIAGATGTAVTLVQYELAARACPAEASGTVFATFMAVMNLAATLAAWLGGACYESASAAWGAGVAFPALCLAVAAVTAAGGLLVPLLPAEAAGGRAAA